VKTKTKVIIGIGAIATMLVGLAFATPIVGLISPLLSVGNNSANLEAHGVSTTATGEPFEVRLRTEGPSTYSTQVAAFGYPAHNGWHSHPGMVAVTLTSGSITWYDENCEPTVYNAGDTWLEGSQIHAFKANGPGVQLVAWFITAQGRALRIDQPAPACAANLGL
jgi:quercetin dioxygenase-like cupin family protein